MSSNNKFETASRKLEQFLYAHNIPFQSWHKNEDGMTVWVYPNTDDVRRVVAEYRSIHCKEGSTLVCH